MVEQQLPSFLAELNPNQLKAAQTLHGPVLIQAGAGSGKTKTVIARIMNLIAHGVNPSNILAITFTNKAANELKARIGQVLAPAQADAVKASTIHSLCVSILAKYQYEDPYIRGSIHKGFPNIIDDEDQKRIIRTCQTDYLSDDPEAKSLDSATLEAIKDLPIGTLKKYINRYKHFYIERKLGINPNASFSISMEDRSLTFYIQKIISNYVKYTVKYNLIDFDDILYNALTILKTNNVAVSQLQSQYQYISVDEYQDTSNVQEQIINILANTKQHNLCVVGDPNQSIYAFRGADINNILTFPKKHPNTRVVTLDENYRSTQSILKLANDVIGQNPNPYSDQLELKAVKGDLYKPKIFEASNRYDQAEQVAKIIEQKKLEDPTLHYRDIGVLYRNNRSGMEMQTKLAQYDIPFYTVKNDNIYASSVAKDLLAYLSLIKDHNNDDSLIRIINTPSRGIGIRTIELLRQLRDQLSASSIYEIMQHLNELVLKGYQVSPRIVSKCNTFVNLIDQIKILDNITLADTLKYIMDKCGYGAYLDKLALDNGENKKKDIAEQFMLLANRYDIDHPNITLLERANGFINKIKLNEMSNKSEKDKDAVQLSTIHSAKGLEYKIVFVIDLADDILPTGFAIKMATSRKEPNLAPIHEERRLIYVAITRAKNDLYLSYPRYTIEWNGDMSEHRLTRFLEDFKDNDCIDITKKEKDEN